MLTSSLASDDDDDDDDDDQQEKEVKDISRGLLSLDLIVHLILVS
jgi:hypothetical protein